MQEMQLRPLGWEDPLEEEMATHSNILAWEIPMTEKPGSLQSMEPQRVGHDWAQNGTAVIQRTYVESAAYSSHDRKQVWFFSTNPFIVLKKNWV